MTSNVLWELGPKTVIEVLEGKIGNLNSERIKAPGQTLTNLSIVRHHSWVPVC